VHDAAVQSSYTFLGRGGMSERADADAGAEKPKK